MIIIVNQKKLKETSSLISLSNIGTLLIWAFSVFFVIFYFKFPVTAANSVKSALETCAVGLIPSLFPITAAVNIMNTSGFSNRIARICGPIIGRLFSISRDAVYAFVLGTVGGFPIGAICVRELINSGSIEKQEAERILCFTNNAGPAFCIGVVGTAVFKDTLFGVKLYFCQLAAAVIIGLAQRKCGKFRNGSSVMLKSGKTFELISESVYSAGLTMLKVCSFAVFFAVLGDAVFISLTHFFNRTFSTVCTSVFELTYAVRRAAELEPGAAYVFSAFSVGWSGLSVHMQTASVLSGSGISLKRYYIAKLLQGTLSAIFIYFLT